MDLRLCGGCDRAGERKVKGARGAIVVVERQFTVISAWSRGIQTNGERRRNAGGQRGRAKGRLDGETDWYTNGCGQDEIAGAKVLDRKGFAKRGAYAGAAEGNAPRAIGNGRRAGEYLDLGSRGERRFRRTDSRCWRYTAQERLGP